MKERGLKQRWKSLCSKALPRFLSEDDSLMPLSTILADASEGWREAGTTAAFHARFTQLRSDPGGGRDGPRPGLGRRVITTHKPRLLTDALFT